MPLSGAHGRLSTEVRQADAALVSAACLSATMSGEADFVNLTEMVAKIKTSLWTKFLRDVKNLNKVLVNFWGVRRNEDSYIPNL